MLPIYVTIQLISLSSSETITIGGVATGFDELS